MNEIFLKLSQSKCKTNSKSVLDIRKVYLEDLLESIREKSLENTFLSSLVYVSI